MKHSQILLVVLLFLTAAARAQTTSLQTPKIPIKKEATTPVETNDAGRLPYSGQTNYDAMGGIPQYRAEPTDLSYIGVLGEKWETDKRGRRSSFIHNGFDMSISRNLPVNKPEIRIDTIPQIRPKMPIK